MPTPSMPTAAIRRVDEGHSSRVAVRFGLSQKAHDGGQRLLLYPFNEPAGYVEVLSPDLHRRRLGSFAIAVA